MTDLLTRLTEGRGADREIDAEFWCAFYPQYDASDDRPGFVLNRNHTDFGWAYTSDFTDPVTGIGHCIALAEKCLPGWNITMRKAQGSTSMALLINSAKRDVYFGEEHPELNRAFMIAMVKAKREEK